MLGTLNGQARAYFKEEMVPTDKVTFVRADIARLPFPDDSVDGLHAGAAIHCWPNPQVQNPKPQTLNPKL